MKTAVTDRTLSYMKFDTEHTTPEALNAYTKAVLACGADYIELTSDAASAMGLEDFSEKYKKTNIWRTFAIYYRSTRIYET